MKIKKNSGTRWLLWVLVLLMALPPGGIMAQSTDSGGPTTFRQEELDQMLAPIALYPDELLSQVLMSATYPLEVVEAARWIQANPNLKGDPLAAALEDKDWDPSVKSLVNFPSILQMMNDQLEWTEMLGDAFLAQPDQVMDTVQKLRQKAQAQGSLRNTNEQRIILKPQIQTIVIEPADPQVVYIPVYDPMIVYGPWWWPAYPPFFYHPRGVIVPSRFIGFGFGVAIGVAWGYAWGGCDWHQHRVVVNITRNVNLNNRIDRNRYASQVTRGTGGRGIWIHDPNHRRGIAYRSPVIARQFGRGPLPGVEARRGFRGYDQTPTRGSFIPRANHPDLPQPRVTTAPNVVRSQPFRQPVLPAQQPQVSPGPGPSRTGGPRQPTTPGRQAVQGLQPPTAFGGFGPKDQTRQASIRGHESLSGGKAPRPAPGGDRTSPGNGRSGESTRHERGK